LRSKGIGRLFPGIDGRLCSKLHSGKTRIAALKSVLNGKESDMRLEILAAITLVCILASSQSVLSAKLSRGECINLVKEKYGTVDVHWTVRRDGVAHCLKYGPGAI
jgi:hypothetical protein